MVKNQIVQFFLRKLELRRNYCKASTLWRADFKALSNAENLIFSISSSFEVILWRNVHIIDQIEDIDKS